MLGDEVLVVSLVRLVDRAAEWSPSGGIELRLIADTPMVSDDVWHELIVTRHESPDAAGSNPIDDPAVAAAMSLMTRPESSG